MAEIKSPPSPTRRLARILALVLAVGVPPVSLYAWYAHQEAMRREWGAIQAAGGHPRYSELPGVGHESWPYAYAILGKPTPTPGFFAWLFAQSKAA